MKMIKAIVAAVTVAIMAVVVGGCKATSFEWKKTDGTVVKASDRRLFISTAAKLEGSVETNGTVKITADVKSDPHADAIRAAAEGAVKGALTAGGLRK